MSHSPNSEFHPRLTPPELMHYQVLQRQWSYRFARFLTLATDILLYVSFGMAIAVLWKCDVLMWMIDQTPGAGHTTLLNDLHQTVQIGTAAFAACMMGIARYPAKVAQLLYWKLSGIK